MISFDETPVPIWKIPFPAVTICPETKAKMSLFNFTKIYYELDNDRYSNVSPDELEYFQSMIHLCEDDDSTHDFDIPETFDTDDIIKVLKNLSPDFKETVIYCEFRGEVTNCSDLFFPMITEDGVCYTFNSISGYDIYRSESITEIFPYHEPNRSTNFWEPDKGYSDDRLQIYPERGYIAGRRSGLSVALLLYDYDFDYLCRGLAQGFKVILHNPSDQPRASEDHTYIQLGSETTIKIRPKLTVTQSNLQDYAPHMRLCYFSQERHLKFFNIYTKSNCELECLTNYTLSKCGCVKFDMPRDNSTKVCDINQIACYTNAVYDMLELEIDEEMYKTTDSNISLNCQCLPSCNSIEYESDVTQTTINWKNFMIAMNKTDRNFDHIQIARFSIYFRTSKFIAHKRSELYSNTEFLANFGGLIGMFLGASLLSIVEIIYFCIIELISKLSRKSGNTSSFITFVAPVK